MLEVVDNKMPTVVKAFPSGVIVAYENNSIPLFIAVPRLGIDPESWNFIWYQTHRNTHVPRPNVLFGTGGLVGASQYLAPGSRQIHVPALQFLTKVKKFTFSRVTYASLQCPEQELNPHLLLRTELFYPLNYRGGVDTVAYSVCGTKNASTLVADAIFPSLSNWTLLFAEQFFYLPFVKADDDIVADADNWYAHLTGHFDHFLALFGVG